MISFNSTLRISEIVVGRDHAHVVTVVLLDSQQACASTAILRQRRQSLFCLSCRHFNASIAARWYFRIVDILFRSRKNLCFVLSITVVDFRVPLYGLHIRYRPSRARGNRRTVVHVVVALIATSISFLRWTNILRSNRWTLIQIFPIFVPKISCLGWTDLPRSNSPTVIKLLLILSVPQPRHVLIPALDAWWFSSLQHTRQSRQTALLSRTIHISFVSRP